MHIHVSMHIHYNAYSFLCIFISMQCIFISMHIHYHAYPFSCIFISIHIQIYTYSRPCIFTSLCPYKLQPKPYTERDIQTEDAQDRHVQIHRYDYRRYYMTEYRLYVTTDYLVISTINTVIVESFVVVITRIAKQYFTRLYCDSSK